MLFRKDDWAYSKLLLAWLLCFGIFVARSWVRLQAHQLLAEDGTIFFATAYNTDFLGALTAPYAGYYHLLPRLLAEAAAFLPYAVAPFAYGLAAIMVNATATSWLQLPHFRFLIRNDWIRLGVVLLIALSPNVESVNLISFTQWFVIWWAVLVVLMPLDNPWLRAGVLVAYVIGIWSAPVLTVLVPLWLLRAWRARTKTEELTAAIILLANLLLVLALLTSGSKEAGLPTDWSKTLADFGHAVAYRLVGATLLGDAVLERWRAAQGWTPIIAFAILAALLLLTATALALRSPARTDARRRVAILALLYVAVAVTATYLLRSSLNNFGFLSETITDARLNNRYFFVAGAVLLVLLGLLLDQLTARRPLAGAVSTALAFGLMAVLYMPSLPLPFFFSPDWTPYGRLLDALAGRNTAQLLSVQRASPLPLPPATQPSAAAPQSPYQLYAPYIAKFLPLPSASIPTTPQSWRVALTEVGPQPFVELGAGLTLAGVTANPDATTRDALAVDLVWQAARGLPTAVPMQWPVALSVRDAAGQVAACVNLVVTTPQPWQWPDELFLTQAAIPQPPANATYTVAIGSCSDQGF